MRLEWKVFRKMEPLLSCTSQRKSLLLLVCRSSLLVLRIQIDSLQLNLVDDGLSCMGVFISSVKENGRILQRKLSGLHSLQLEHGVEL